MFAVASAGADGWALIVTGVGEETQVLSVDLLTNILLAPGATPAKVTEAWYAPPLMLYSYAPRGPVTAIVPVATAQVGCVVLTVGAAGAVGCELITILADAGEVHPEAFVTE